jgi:hypothetical protein
VRAFDRRLSVVLVTGALAVTLASTPYYYGRNLEGFLRVRPPHYLTSGDVAAMEWLAGRTGDSVVLARSDISPWVAVRSNHRVLVGHYLWTHDWSERQRQVDAVFDGGRSPRRLLKAFHVRWILLDTERGVPAWAVRVPPVARFDATSILRAADVVGRGPAQTSRDLG